MDGGGIWVGLAAVESAAMATFLLWKAIGRAKRSREARLVDALTAAARALDPDAPTAALADGVASVELVAGGEACSLLADPGGPSGVECVLRAAVPAVAVAAMMRERTADDGARVATGDPGFDDLFTVSARTPGVARVLSERVRRALLALPRGAHSPRLSVEAGVLELAWRGEPSEVGARLALAVVAAVRAEFRERVPLR